MTIRAGCSVNPAHPTKLAKIPLKGGVYVNIKKDFTKKFKRSYALIVILFTIIVISLLGARRVFLNFVDKTRIVVENTRVREFNSILRNAQYIADYELNSSIQKINSDVEKEADLSRLKIALTLNTNYDVFDYILRKNLQTNIFVANGFVDPNRNNIFVLVNGYLVASYNQDDTYLKDPIKTGSKIKVKEIITNDFYNKELSIRALHQLEIQDKGLIIWQARKPSDADDDYKPTPRIDLKKLDDILRRGTKEELASYEILVPKYITETGNIFGEYDVAGSPKGVNNKIIIVQKINMVDWIEYLYPDFFDMDETDTIAYNYNQVMNIINIFLIMACISMFGYGLWFAVSYNHAREKYLEEDADESESKDPIGKNK